MLREHERRVLDGHLARARGQVVTGAGGPAAALLSRLGGWVMAGAYPVWTVVRRPFEPLMKPFAGRPLPLRVIAAVCAVAVAAALVYMMLMEEPKVEVVRAGERELARVTAQTLNVRAGPGVDFGLVGRAYRDEQLPIVEVREDWVQVRLSDLDEAWVSSRYVERETEPVLGERPVPRHGWIFLLIAGIGYLALVGVSQVMEPPHVQSTSSARPAPKARAIPEGTSSRGARSGGVSADRDAVEGQADAVGAGSPANGDPGAGASAELRAHLRAARTLLLEGMSSSRRDDFQRLWQTFQRRLMDALDVEDAG